jgi:hypothetical protein
LNDISCPESQQNRERDVRISENVMYEVVDRDDVMGKEMRDER